MRLNNIIVILSCALYLICAFLEMRYNLHMFQLNGYKNKEHFKWIKKNFGIQRIVLIPAIAGVLVFALPLIFTKIVFCILVFLVGWYFSYLRKIKVKKKLVYTMRVKRLVVTNSIIIIFMPFFAWMLSGQTRFFWLLLGLLTCLEPLLVMLSNLLNTPIERGVNNHFVNDAKKKLRQMPELTVIGVTGSYGKTSVKYYLGALLQSKFNVLITPESYNTPMGVVKTIRESLKPTHQIFVCEMGARHVGDIKEICDIVHPKHGMITSIGPQHLETFFSMDNIVKTKFELADALPNGGFLFLNADNEYITQKEGYKDRIYYSTNQAGMDGYYAKDVVLSQLGTTFTFVTPDKEEKEFQTRLIGTHNVINIVGAIAVAHKLGISLSELKVPVRRLQPVAHRLQMIERGNVTIIDDAYNSNPVGSKVAVETLSLFDGVKILVTPGMVELGKEEERYNYEFGKYAAANCDHILLVGKKHTEPIAKGALDAGFAKENLRIVDQLDEAISFAYAIRTEAHKYILLENDLPDNY